MCIVDIDKRRGDELMNNIEVTFKALEDRSEAVSKAAEVKRSGTETHEETWERIFATKLTVRDKGRLQEVKKAMEDELISRRPENLTTKTGKPRNLSKAEALNLWHDLEKLKRVERIQEMVEEVPPNYELVLKKERLKEVIDELLKEEIVVFDVETTGTDVWSDKVVGHVLSATSADKHYYIPTDHDDDVEQLDRYMVAEMLKPVYQNESIGLIAHNAKFDVAMLRNNFDIEIKNLLWDTQEAQLLLNENEDSIALKPLATKYLKDESYTYKDLFGDRGFNEVPLDQALAYAAKDGDITYRLYLFQVKHMKEHGNIYEYFTNVEMPLMKVTSDIELTGYVIDEEYAGIYGDELAAGIVQMEEDLVRELGDINMNSPVQLKEALEKSIGKPLKNTSAKETLKPMAEDYPIINTLLKYREDSKTLNTYVRAIPQLLKSSGRVHTALRQNGTVTGRFGSGEDKNSVSRDGVINVQNQSPESRPLFVAPDNRLIVNADFKAQEVRIIASLSKEEVLLDAFARGVDAYATLASEFFNKPYEECYKNPDGSDTKARAQMKVVLLSSMYGASKYGLSNSLGISVEEAEEFRLEFFNKYRNIDAFIKDTQDFAKKNGFVWIGNKDRKRRLPMARKKRKFIPYGEWNNPKHEKARRMNGEIMKSLRQGPNAKVQGLAAIQTKVTMLEMDKLLKKRGWEWFAPIHDELAIITEDELTEEDFRMIDDVMTQSYLLSGVDNETDIEVQKRWSKFITAEQYLQGERPKL